MLPPVRREVARFLQVKLPELLNVDVDTERGGRPQGEKRSLRAAADMLEVPYPSLQKLIRKGEGAGNDFEQKVADLYFKGSVDQLRREAKAWYAEYVETVEATTQPEPETIARVFAIARRMKRSDFEAFKVASNVAAMQGDATDEEIAAMFTPSKSRSGTTNRTIGSSDDLDGGRSSTPHVPRRKK